MRTITRTAIGLLLACGLTACGGGGAESAGDAPGAQTPPGDDRPPFDQPIVLSFDDFQAADAVIGQFDLSAIDTDAGLNTANGIGLYGPYGSADGLYVPDEGHDRILGFNSVPVGGGAVADFVLGQPDFESTDGGTTASSFEAPYDCTVAGNRLFVVDHYNHRVLIWNALPKSNTPADVVVGQSNFTSKTAAVSAAGLSYPEDATVAGGRLFVADGRSNRVLIWNSIPATNGQPADVVVGQTNFTSSSTGTSATALSGPTGVWASESRLVISDFGNRRVLIYNTIPTSNGAAADAVIGAPDFDTRGSPDPSATSISGPRGLASDGTSLFVSDTANHRVLIFPFPIRSGDAASGILGQRSFEIGAPNDVDQDGVRGTVGSARTFSGPQGLAIVGNKLLVSDYYNYRVLVFTSRGR